jgi:hypothetical protein
VLGEKNEVIHEGKKPDNEKFHHFDDFVDAIRNSRRPSADILEGHRSVAIVHLSNIALRAGRSLDFDPRTETILGDPEASALLSRTYRQGGHWAIPNGV